MNKYIDIFVEQNKIELNYYESILKRIGGKIFDSYYDEDDKDLRKIISEENNLLENKNVKIKVFTDFYLDNMLETENRLYTFMIIFKKNYREIIISYDLNKENILKLSKIGLYNSRKEKSLELKHNNIRIGAKNNRNDIFEVIVFEKKDQWEIMEQNNINKIEVGTYNFIKENLSKVCDMLILNNTSLKEEIEVYNLSNDIEINMDIYKIENFNMKIKNLIKSTDRKNNHK